MRPVEGVVVPLLTPIRADETPNCEQLRGLTEYVIAGGVNAIFVNGTSGEFARFTPDERNDSLRAVVEAANGRVPVLAGVSDCGTRLALENAKRAAEAGASAVVATLPYYFPTGSRREQSLFLEKLLDGSPLPVFFYNIPAIVGCNIDLDVFRSFVGHANLCGVKDTSGDAELLRALIRACDGRAVALVGDERLLCQGLSMGAAGMVPSLANAFPCLLRAVWEAARAGDWDACRRHCDVVDGMNRALNGFSDSWMSPNIWRKEALAQMGVIDATFTSPHSDMTQADREQTATFVRYYREHYA